MSTLRLRRGEVDGVPAPRGSSTRLIVSCIVPGRLDAVGLGVVADDLQAVDERHPLALPDVRPRTVLGAAVPSWVPTNLKAGPAPAITTRAVPSPMIEVNPTLSSRRRSAG